MANRVEMPPRLSESRDKGLIRWLWELAEKYNQAMEQLEKLGEPEEKAAPVSLAGYVRRMELDAINERIDGKADPADIPDISGKADRNEIPDISGKAEAADLQALQQTVSGLAARHDWKVGVGDATVTIAGNTDTNITISNAPAHSWMAAAIVGYTPSASWDTRLITKASWSGTGTPSFPVRTQGGTSQTYTVLASFLYY